MIYAVNKETKEHLIAEIPPLDFTQWMAVEADADGWIEWHGGECPLPNGNRCQYRMRDGDTSAEDAEALLWDHEGDNYDIIAYRPILDDKPQTQGWNGDGLPPVGAVCEYRYPEGDEFRRGRCVAHYRGMAVMIDSEDEGAQLATIVRAVKTERERWLETACSKLGCASGSLAADWLADLYGAGLAKLPTP